MDHLIVVLTYNKPRLAEARAAELTALYANNPLVSFLVFDNGSTDPHVRLLRASLEGRGVPTAHLTENVGFARGMNSAVRIGGEMVGEATFIHLLSDDVAVLGEFALQAAKALAALPLTVACHRMIDWRAGWNVFDRLVIPYPDGYYIAMRRETWDALGGFDEDFQPYDYEDVDLGYRCGLKGIPLIALPHLPLQHIPASTIGYTPERRTQTLKMRRLFAEKHGLPLVPEEP